jgi:cytochrome c oxidase cbb3-type subunit 3
LTTLILAGSLVLVLYSVAQQSMLPKLPSQSAKTMGQRVFSSTCAGCHGLDGRGSERAPNIAQEGKSQRLSDAELIHIIQEGISGTGMPAFHSLGSSDIQAVVKYLRALQGAKIMLRLPGDPEHGKTVFFGQAKCSSCHMVAGSGGFLASDLSGYAHSRSVEEIRKAVTNPKQAIDAHARSVVAITRDGEKYAGRIRNEDNFSLQLQAFDGTFHFLLKSDLERLEYNSQSLMPSDYGSTLSSKDLDDVTSYLITSARTSESENAKEGNE